MIERAEHLKTAMCDLSGKVAVITGEARGIGRAIAEGFDKVDILVNNAGISGSAKPINELADEEWQHTLGINLTGSRSH